MSFSYPLDVVNINKLLYIEEIKICMVVIEI